MVSCVAARYIFRPIKTRLGLKPAFEQCHSWQWHLFVAFQVSFTIFVNYTHCSCIEKDHLETIAQEQNIYLNNHFWQITLKEFFHLQTLMKFPFLWTSTNSPCFLPHCHGSHRRPCFCSPFALGAEWHNCHGIRVAFLGGRGIAQLSKSQSY